MNQGSPQIVADFKEAVEEILDNIKSVRGREYAMAVHGVFCVHQAALVTADMVGALRDAGGDDELLRGACESYSRLFTEISGTMVAQAAGDDGDIAKSIYDDAQRLSDRQVEAFTRFYGQ